ncbi:retrovirus-related pol polyprotein from transposon TNT 1-94 [Tanacetum coccineum]
MDYGGSFHMTPRRDFWFNFKEFNSDTVLLGDNRACTIIGIGKVRVQMKDGLSFMLENVRYIPELKRNLISLGTLDREGYTVKLRNGRVKGPSRVESMSGCRYFLSIVDDYSRRVWVHFLRHKNESFSKFKEWKQLMENQTGTPQQKGLAERMNRTLLNKVRCLLIQSGLPDSFWVEATVTAAYLINRSPYTTLEKNTPMDLWSGHPTNYDMLRIFGCVAYSHVNQGKLKPTSIKCIFLGYPDGVKGYRLWRLDDVKPKIIISRDVVFNESLIYKDTLKGAGAADSEKEVEFEVELQGTKRTTTIPVRYMDEGNVSLSKPSGSKVDDMAAYAFAIAEEEDTHEPITFLAALA